MHICICALVIVLPCYGALEIVGVIIIIIIIIIIIKGLFISFRSQSPLVLSYFDKLNISVINYFRKHR